MSIAFGMKSAVEKWAKYFPPEKKTIFSCTWIKKAISNLREKSHVDVIPTKPIKKKISEKRSR